MAKFAEYPSLKGRTVFITGGATGIGAAMVRAFTEQGAHVGHLDMAEDAAEALADDLAADGHTRPWFRAVDVTDITALQETLVEFVKSSGGLAVLVNNVANDTRHDPIATTIESWRQCMAVNLDSAFFAARQAIDLMRQGGGGSIINFSSINALTGPGQMPGYVTAKAGIIGMTKALATQYGVDGIRVNTILPGWVDTERQRKLWMNEEALAEWMQMSSLKTLIAPKDVASLAMFLAADDSRMITSQQFVIDAGRV